jgi:beta-glucosidase-like glycosyl hydrolase/CubicO group peptidase (beta-lactamase class C family)
MPLFSRSTRFALRTCSLCAALLVGCHSGALQTRAKPQPSSAQWIEATLARMTLREKLGQMFIYYLDANFKPGHDAEWRKIQTLVHEHGIGGLHLWNGEPYATGFMTNHLQASSKTPLFFTADLENGAARFRGARFPPNMAIAATNDTNAAFAMGFHTAREARALGVNLNLAPVADVNNNPENPIINTRSFGEEPQAVGDFVAAYIRGCQTGGMLSTAKHFPGHGDTKQDTHIELAYIASDRARLAQVELAPFRGAIAAGVDAIMIAHLNVPSLGMNPYAPATMSPEIMTGLLRERLGFEGLVITDAMNMWAVNRNDTPAFAAAAAIRAGADVILAQDDIPETIAALESRVLAGEIALTRIDDSVRRILRAKAKLGLHGNRAVSLDSLASRVSSLAAAHAAENAARRAMTLLQNENDLLPLRDLTGESVVLINVWDAPQAAAVTPFMSELQRFLPGFRAFHLHAETSQAEFDKIVPAAKKAKLQIIPVYTRIASWKGATGLPQALQPRLDALLDLDAPAVVVSLGNPYIYPQAQNCAAYLVAYDDGPLMSTAAARALIGLEKISGRLPITIPNYFERGAGITVEALSNQPKETARALAPTLRYGFTHEAGFESARLDSVRGLVQQAVRDSVFPGAVLLLGRNATIALHEAFGNLGYGEFERPMPLNAIFDMASVTKVIATTTACMLLHERGLLALEAPVQSYLPNFTGKDKEKITVRHLLTHSSGLIAFRRYFLDYHTPEEILDVILKEEPTYPPGTQTVYSDLGVILLGKIIELVSGKSLEEFCRDEIFAPLRLHETFYKPDSSLLSRIAPTELDTLTLGRKGAIVHGTVHDENAYTLGGVSAHAGLFSTARDAGAFVQMLLNGGSYGELQLLKPETVALFIKRQDLVAGSSRALGWDTADGKNSAGALMSAEAFGHTGFTGVSVWADPKTRLFVVLLSNRVHPTRENRRILSFRAKLHEMIVRAMSPQ